MAGGLVGVGRAWSPHPAMGGPVLAVAVLALVMLRRLPLGRVRLVPFLRGLVLLGGLALLRSARLRSADDATCARDRVRHQDRLRAAGRTGGGDGARRGWGRRRRARGRGRGGSFRWTACCRS